MTKVHKSLMDHKQANSTGEHMELFREWLFINTRIYSILAMKKKEKEKKLEVYVLFTILISSTFYLVSTGPYTYLEAFRYLRQFCHPWLPA